MSTNKYSSFEINNAELLKKIKRICKDKDNKSYVYKLCNDELSRKDKSRKWLVIMRKLSLTEDYPRSTKTNEKRSNVHKPDMRTAKFRADELEVVKIININKPSRTKKYVVNITKTSNAKANMRANVRANTRANTRANVRANARADMRDNARADMRDNARDNVKDNTSDDCIDNIKTKYVVGEIIKSDKYDDNIENVCSPGIHYFKSPIAAYYYRDVPSDFTGRWYKFYDNGCLKVECDFVKGQKSGNFIMYFDNGQKMSEGSFNNNLKSGLWTEFYDNGNIFSRGEYVFGLKSKTWINWYKNGNRESKSYFTKGKLDGPVIEWNSDKSLKNKSYLLYSTRN
jgi:antitoxin component YwqK of YwqJK toxin-antitoxin module